MLSVDEILLTMNMNWFTNFRGLTFSLSLSLERETERERERDRDRERERDRAG